MAWPRPHHDTRSRPRTIGAVLLCAVFASACVNRLPPADTPEPVVPDADLATPPPEGHGRLVVDVVEGPAPVQRVRMKPERIEKDDGRASYELRETYEDLCDTTPCVLDLRPGNVILGFPVIGDEDALQIDLVHVGDGTSVYRRSLAVVDSRKRPGYKLGIAGTVLGSVAMVTGTALLPVGLADDNSELALAGGVTLGAGVALMALGIWLINAKAPTYRPGSWTHYPLSVETGAP